MNKVSRRTFIGVGAAAIAATQLGKTRAIAQSPLLRVAQTTKSQVLTLYSACRNQVNQALCQQFTDATGIEVNLIEAKADLLVERIKGEALRSPADVLITTGAGYLWQAEQERLLQEISSPILQAAIPENLRNPQGQWFACSRRARVVLYNKTKVDAAELSSYEALADPKWRGQILISSALDLCNQLLVSSILKTNELQRTTGWARGMAANFARPPEGNDIAQIRACAAGVGNLAIADTSSLVRLTKSDDPAERAAAEKIGVFFPNQFDRGTHINISGAGVLQNAPNLAAAVKFLEHLLSPRVQKTFAKEGGEYPVLEQVSLDSVLESFGRFKPDPTNPAILSQNTAIAFQLMDQAGWT